jgi:hypothetical protein
MADQEMGTKHDLCVGDSLYVAGEPQKMTERDYGELLSNSKVCGILYPSGNPVPVVSLVAQRGKKHCRTAVTLHHLRYNQPMNTSQILTHIEEEISRLRQLRALLSGEETTSTRLKPGPKPGKTVTAKKRVLSPESRARIVAAQKARWAKAKKAA